MNEGRLGCARQSPLPEGSCVCQFVRPCSGDDLADASVSSRNRWLFHRLFLCPLLLMVLVSP